VSPLVDEEGKQAVGDVGAVLVTAQTRHQAHGLL
jgi:hypothetical protein